MFPYGFSWVVSVSTLMIIGYVIEVMILKETIFATQIELFQNEEKWQEIKSFYIRKNEIQAFIKGLADGHNPNLPSSPENSANYIIPQLAPIFSNP